MHDFARVLPVIVIAEMLGVELEHHAEFERWSDNIVRGTSRSGDEANVQRSAEQQRDARLFHQAIALRRKEPRNKTC